MLILQPPPVLELQQAAGQHCYSTNYLADTEVYIRSPPAVSIAPNSSSIGTRLNYTVTGSLRHFLKMLKLALLASGFIKTVLACSTPAPQAIGPSQDVNPTYNPVPEFAVGLPLNSDGYRIEDFGKGAYMITNGYYQAMALVSTKGVIMVDAPPSIGQNLLYAVGNITHLPITHQVYSHSHTDHNGASFLYGNVTRIGHRLTRDYLALANDPYRPLPDKTFSDEMTLTVGNQTLQLKNRGPNHSPDNTYIYAPAQKVLVLIDSK